MNQTEIKLVPGAVAQNTMIINQEGGPHEIQIQVAHVDLSSSSSEYSQGVISLIYDSVTHLCAWRIFLIQQKKNPTLSYANAKSDFVVDSKNKLFYTQAQRYSMAHDSLQFLLNSIKTKLSLYSSNEILLIFEISALNLHRWGHNIDSGSNLEIVRQKIFTRLLKHLHFESSSELRAALTDIAEKDIPLNLSEVYKSNEEIYRFVYHVSDRPIFNARHHDELALHIHQIKEISGGWRIVLEGTDKRYVTLVLDKDFEWLYTKENISLE